MAKNSLAGEQNADAGVAEIGQRLVVPKRSHLFDRRTHPALCLEDSARCHVVHSVEVFLNGKVSNKELSKRRLIAFAVFEPSHNTAVLGILA